jgi:hypothetical protein
MTDKELLELASKAAGYRMIDIDGLFYEPREPTMQQWDPLTDDGDALRLAVRLRMMLTPSDDGHEVRVDLYTGHHWTEHCDDGAGTATRRAIVRAAAEIGKTLKD